MAQVNTLAISSLFPRASVPSILAEWAALVPLVCHIASYQQDHRLAGEACLMGRLSVDLFPKLGALYGIARLLDDRSAFLDRACVMSDSKFEVWDINWGSQFLCANGVASAIVSAYALRQAHNVIRMPEIVTSRSLHGKKDGLADGVAAKDSEPCLTATESENIGAFTTKTTHRGVKTISEALTMQNHKYANSHAHRPTFGVTRLFTSLNSAAKQLNPP